MKRIKKVYLIILLILGCFIFTACKEKATYELVVPENLNYKEGAFSLTDYKIHIKAKGIDTYVDVTKDMIQDANVEEFASVGAYSFTVSFKSLKEVVDINVTRDRQYVDIAYYMSANGLYGDELKQELRNIISKVTKIEKYDDLRTDLQITDKGSDGTIICFYCHQETNATWDGGLTWNREHVWPQSLGWFSTTMAGADIHHLRPCHQSENSSRGNTPYGESKSFYNPKDDVKGDIARILFYLYVRYAESDRYSLDTVCESFDMLLRWNKLDPVDSLEIQRNEEGYKIQGNRNPFIDNPDYADFIWANL